MAATPIAATTRYFDPATTKCYYVLSIVDKNAPTRVELDGGTDLTPEIADLAGFSLTGGEIDTPDMGSLFTSRIPGRLEAEDSSLTFYADQGGVDVRDLLPLGTDGFIVWLDGGDVAGYKMGVYPIRVRSNAQQRSAGDEPARILVQFSITRQPAEGVAVPA